MIPPPAPHGGVAAVATPTAVTAPHVWDPSEYSGAELAAGQPAQVVG
jgi:hypothetical protein